MIPEFFKHQLVTIDFLSKTPRAFDMSDPGTAKTRAHLADAISRRGAGGGKILVVAPKSILQLAWGDDIDKFFPGVRYSIAYATNREKAFRADADIYITNHDAVKWLTSKECPLPRNYLDAFGTLILDESSAFKHASAARSKSARKLSQAIPFMRCMSGTPNSNTIMDIWHQVFMLDQGERLGNSFWKLRNQVCEPKQNGPLPQHVKWVDKPGAEALVYDMIRDISIRHRLEDCVDIPPNHQWNLDFDLDRKTRKAYDDMLRDAVAALESGRVITAIHASSLNQKLLQIAAGAAYTGLAPGDYVEISDTRSEIVLDQVRARSASVVPFIWHHQRDQLSRLAKNPQNPVTFEVIDGGVDDRRRVEIVRDFQAGNLQMLLVHPQSAGHGLTLTKGVATIMASPTYNAEHYKQVFHRVYRASQTHKTETIHVRAKSTIDEHVYDGRLGPKLDSMALFLSLIEQAKENR